MRILSLGLVVVTALSVAGCDRGPDPLAAEGAATPLVELAPVEAAPPVEEPRPVQRAARVEPVTAVYSPPVYREEVYAPQPVEVTRTHVKRDAAIGAGVGAAVGAIVHDRNRLKGAVVGGVIGGVAGGIVGATIDKKTTVIYP